MSMNDIIRSEARLIVLRALSDEPNYALNDSILMAELERFGIGRSRDWLREELRRLADLDAVDLREAGSAIIVTLTPKGADHAGGRLVIEGVKRPTPR